MYSTLYCLTLRAWPKHLKQVQRIAQHFWGTLDELSLEDYSTDGKAHLHPPELLDHTLADLHRAHQEMEKMQAQAKKAVYLPSIYDDILDYV